MKYFDLCGENLKLMFYFQNNCLDTFYYAPSGLGVGGNPFPGVSPRAELFRFFRAFQGFLL